VAQFAKAGVDVGALAAQIRGEGAKSFVKSWDELMSVIDMKSGTLKKASKAIPIHRITEQEYGDS
jgi:transaldolase